MLHRTTGWTAVFRSPSVSWAHAEKDMEPRLGSATAVMVLIIAEWGIAFTWCPGPARSCSWSCNMDTGFHVIWEPSTAQQRGLGQCALWGVAQITGPCWGGRAAGSVPLQR